MSDVEDAVRALLHDPDLDRVTPGPDLLAAVRARHRQQRDRHRHAAWAALASVAAVVMAAVVLFVRPGHEEHVRPATPPAKTVSVTVTVTSSVPVEVSPSVTPNRSTRSPTGPRGTNAPSGSSRPR